GQTLHRVDAELVLVGLDCVQTDGGDVVDRDPETEGLRNRGRSGFERARQVIERRLGQRGRADHLAAEIVRRHRLVQRGPAPPSGPHSWWDETGPKQAPSAGPSTLRCGAACAASTTMIAPSSWAHAATFSTGLIVPIELETRPVATTLTAP